MDSLIQDLLRVILATVLLLAAVAKVVQPRPFLQTASRLPMLRKRPRFALLAVATVEIAIASALVVGPVDVAGALSATLFMCFLLISFHLRNVMAPCNCMGWSSSPPSNLSQSLRLLAVLGSLRLIWSVDGPSNITPLGRVVGVAVLTTLGYWLVSSMSERPAFFRRVTSGEKVPTTTQGRNPTLTRRRLVAVGGTVIGSLLVRPLLAFASSTSSQTACIPPCPPGFTCIGDQCHDYCLGPYMACTHLCEDIGCFSLCGCPLAIGCLGCLLPCDIGCFLLKVQCTQDYLRCIIPPTGPPP
jgi:uncharacterized membrane protein YphA (DoxX/SURF4 family)